MGKHVEVNYCIQQNRFPIEESNNSKQRKGFAEIVHLIVISTTISVFINFVVLSLRSASFICDSSLLNDNIKQKFFNCQPDEKSIRLRSQINPVSYFGDPFIKEYPVQSVNAKEAVEIELNKNPKLSLYDAEAIAAMKAARRFRIAGNLRKAQLVMTHAFLLSPKHPDILTEYGIVLETADDNNIVEAEGFYQRALAQDPQHSEAIIHRARTLPLVEEIDNRMLKEIYRKKDIFLKIPRSDTGLKRAMRESYFQHIYHTVALEGNTMSLVQTRSILETKLAVAGKSIIEHNEILGMDAALRFLNQSLSNSGEISLDHILAIHKRVLGYADPIAAGVIRNTQVYVGGFTPTAPEAIASEMGELIAWLNDEETLALDPVELAALTHYKLVYIHPFVDGNGRTSRLLMNYILMQAGFPPVIINVAQRLQYYSALQRANEGDLRPFIRFIAEETDRTLEGFIASATTMCDTCASSINAQNGRTASKCAEEIPPTIITVL